MSNKVDIKDSAVNIRGNVNLQIRKGNSVIKEIKVNNSGTALLFLGLLKFIRGDFLISTNGMRSYLPNYLGVGNVIVPTPTDMTMTGLSREIDTGERFRVTPTNITEFSTLETASLTLTALVPYSSVGETWITELGLFSTITPSSGTMLVRVPLPMDELGNYGIKLEQGHSLFVQWVINLQSI